MSREIYKLSELCLKITDGSHNPPEGIPHSDYLMLSSKNIFDDEINFDNPRYLSKEMFEKENKRTEISEGDVLLTIVGTIGRVAVVSDDIAKFTLQRSVAVLKPKMDVITPRFLMYTLQSMLDVLTAGARGVAQKGIYLKQLADLQISVPPLIKQKEIVAIFDKVRKIQKKRKKAIKMADDFLRATFLEMFGDPVENPKGWKVKSLKELSVKIASGSTPKGGSKVYVKEGVIFFRSQNVWKNDIRLDDVAYIDEKTHNNLKKSVLKHKDILMTKTGRFNTENSSLGRAALFLGEDNSANVNGHVYLIRLKAEVLHEFILYILTSNEYREHIRDVCVGGIDKRQLNKVHIEDFPIICPPSDLQIEFMRKLNCIQKLRSSSMRGLKEIIPLFNTLNQKAFSNRL